MLEKLLLYFTDQSVKEVLLNGTRSLIIEGQTRQCQDSPYENIGRLQDEVQKFAWSQGMRLDRRRPYAGGIWRGQWRWHIVIEPLACEHTIVSMRRHRFESIQDEDFINHRQYVADIREKFLRNFHIFICGPTGAGKTTYMLSLLKHMAYESRVLIMEQLPEMQLASPYWFHMKAQSADVEGGGEFSLTACMQQALRLRPDYFVIGEIRGEEADCLPLAVSSGHGSVLTTMHATDASQVSLKLRYFLGDLFEAFRSHNFMLIFMQRGQIPVIKDVVSGSGFDIL